jgi:hypothetical protein
MNAQEEKPGYGNRGKTNCRFSTVPTAPTAADNQHKKQPAKTTDDRLHKILDTTAKTIGHALSLLARLIGYCHFIVVVIGVVALLAAVA